MTTRSPVLSSGCSRLRTADCLSCTSVLPGCNDNHSLTSSMRDLSSTCTTTYEPKAPWCLTYGSVIGQMTLYPLPNCCSNMSSTNNTLGVPSDLILAFMP